MAFWIDNGPARSMLHTVGLVAALIMLTPKLPRPEAA